MQRFRAKKIVEYEYDENECGGLPSSDSDSETTFDISKVAFMNGSPSNTSTTKNNNNNNSRS